eukprot:jgi/Galph1/3357/GphlegSOOS_G2057.1
MGSLYRSQPMARLRLFIEKSAAHDTLFQLAERGIFELIDLNSQYSAFQRPFASDIRLCEELQRKLRYLEDQVQSCVTENYRLEDVTSEALQSLQLNDLAEYLRELEVNIKEMNKHWDALKQEEKTIAEHTVVLQIAPKAQTSEYGSILISSDVRSEVFKRRSVTASSEETKSLLGERSQLESRQEESHEGILGYYAGLINFENIHSFERIIFRVSRGNAFLKYSSIEQDSSAISGLGDITKAFLSKRVFVIFYPGTALGNKIRKICDAFSASLYDLPESEIERYRLLQDLDQRYHDLQMVVSSTQSQRSEAFQEILRHLPLWIEKVGREKTVYHALNMLNYDTSHNVYIADGWCPSSDHFQVQEALQAAQDEANAQSPTVVEEIYDEKDTPPTFFKLNKFTVVFQNIIESYGIPRYQELNPAPFTIITFPFLFAIMFGDMGHGALMTIFAAFLILWERKLSNMRLNELLQTCFDGRYMILLMGLFSVYTGLVYNECFGVTLNLFRSRWMFTKTFSFACAMDNCVNTVSSHPPINIYPFGFDPIWSRAQNGLAFFNSYKMKLSIVVGIFQMMMGIFLSYFNARHFKRDLDIWYVFIPQILFMSCTFGYLVVLIFVKWLTNWNAASCVTDPNCQPPDLKATLIGLFMNPGNVPKNAQLIPFQGFIQPFLLFIAIISVPWMLFPKPLILLRRHRKQWRQDIGTEEERVALLDKSEPTNKSNHLGTDSAHDSRDEEPFDFGEVMIHQLIHTIEFVLGAVSNTASYLRLWALSLAHSELSLVFLEKLLYNAIAVEAPLVIMIGFLLWALLTIGVLCLMESLSAFLHALRLHWVEFQNKFYNLKERSYRNPAIDFFALFFNCGVTASMTQVVVDLSICLQVQQSSIGEYKGIPLEKYQLVSSSKEEPHSCRVLFVPRPVLTKLPMAQVVKV